MREAYGRWRAVAAGLCLALLGAAGGARGADAAALERAMAAALREEGLAGAVWGVVEVDGTIRTGAAGFRDLPARAPMRPDDRVQVGSVAKTLLATGVLHLASTGRLDLDAPVESLLPQVRFDNPWRGTDPVRVRHLIDHTAGLEDARWWQFFSAQASPDAPLAGAFARDPSVLRLRTRPGERFSYSNLGYTLAAMVVEAVAGERYERFLGRALLQPLGMRDSTFGFVSQAGAAADPRLAWGHQDDGSVHPAVPVVVRPAGQFTTTARDLALFARFLMGDGRVQGRVLVRGDLLRAMARPRGTAAAVAGLPSGYALGLARRDRHGVVGPCHDGSIVGYRAMLCMFPDAGKAFAIVHNADKEGADYLRFDALMVRALALPSPPRPPVATLPADVGDWVGRYVPAPGRFEPLRYAQMLTESVAVAQAGERLRLQPLGGPVRTLAPAGGYLFTADDRSSVSHVLLRDGDGTPLLVRDGLRTWRRVPAAGYWLQWTSLAVGVLGIAWFLLPAPILGWRAGRRPVLPGVAASWLLLAPVPLFATQSLVQLGDRTPASIALYLASVALPGLMAWQAWRSLRRPGTAERIHLLAAVAVLQWCVVLWWWGMLPHALWR